jgi:hypothetical protein
MTVHEEYSTVHVLSLCTSYCDCNDVPWHRLNCTKDQFVWMLNDIAVNNPKMLLKPLADVLASFPYLADLNVHGHAQTYSVSALCGNGCTVRG